MLKLLKTKSNNSLKLIVSMFICLLASLSVLLLSPFNTNVLASVEDGANTKTQQSEFLIIEDVNTNLYKDNSASTSNLYSIKMWGGGFTSDVSATFENGILKAETTGLGSSGLVKKNPRLETAFRLGSKYNRAVNNGLLNITLNTKVSNSNASKTEVGFQSGTLSVSGSSVNWTGSGNFTKTQIGSTSTATDVTLSFIPTMVGDNADIILVFDNERGGTSSKAQSFTAETPKITLTSKRTSGPNIKNVLVDNKENDYNNWTKESKKITFTVEDNEIGIDYVTINGVKVECDKETLNSDTLKTFTYYVNEVEPKNYNIVAYDYLGGTSTISKRVGYVDNQDVSDIIINAKNAYHEKDISIDISFTEDNTRSPEYVYYVLNDNSTLDNADPNPNDTTGKTKQVNYQDGKYTFNFNFASDGDYTLKVLIADEAGHSKLFSHKFTIDSVKRRVNVSSYHGTFEITGVYEDENGLYTWSGENIIISYQADQYFAFYKLLRNGSEVSTNGSVYNYECKDADITIEILNRFNVEVIPETSYEFSENNTNLVFNLNTSYLQDVLTVEELKTWLCENDNCDPNSLEGLTKEQLLEILTNEISKNIIFKYVYGGFTTDVIYNKGTYGVTWEFNNKNANGDVREYNFYAGSGNFDIVVNAKEFEIEYLENNFTYNGEIQSINFIEPFGQKIIVKYYLDGKEVEFKNAGEYKVILLTNDDNYALTNGEIFVTINKKEVQVNVTNTTFTYNAQEQNINYTLSEDVLSYVKYFTNNGEETIESTFINSGSYTYQILLADETNYLITSNIGSCEILKVNAKVKVNNYTYNYNGEVINLDYTITTLVDGVEEEIAVNGLFVNFMVGENLVSFLEPNTYNFTISTTDINNYILEGELSGTVTIKKTIIKVYLNKTNYEYTGSKIGLDFYFENESNEHLTNLKNVSLQITQNGVVADFINCGTYNYEFVTTDINYQFIYINEDRTLTINKAYVSVNILNDVYEYNANGNILSYKLVSHNGKDYTNNEYISFNITQNGVLSQLNEVGLYTYTFVSSNENIVLDLENYTGIVSVIPKNITIDNIIKSYTYTGEQIDFSYSLSEEIDVVVEIDILLNVGVYSYVITSQNPNYVIINGEGEVIVNPKNIEIENIVTEYVYTGSEILVELNLQMDLDYSLSFNKIDSEDVITNLVNAGCYNVIINIANPNYCVDSNDLLITISPKSVEIVVTNTTQTYNAGDRNIAVRVEDDVKYDITYMQNGVVVHNTKNAGIYEYVVTLKNDNYTGLSSGTFEITKAPLTIKVDADQFKIYGDDKEEVYSYSVSGLMGNDAIDVLLSREQGENVGSYKINLQNINNANYEVNYIFSYYKIIARKLIIVAEDKTKYFEEQDCELSYRITYGTLKTGDSLQGSLKREEGEEVGVYNIDIGSLNNDNYQIIFKPAQFTILPSDLNIKINNVVTTYGVDAPLSFSADRNFNQSMIKGNIEREQGNNAGEYLVTKGSLQSKNYNLIITNGIYTIQPKNANVVATNTVKTYGDSDELSYLVTGILENDILTGNISREQGEDVGVYQINLGTLQALNPNYSFNLQDALFTINKAILTINIFNQTQVYGEEEKELTYSLDGVKLDDEINLKLFRENGTDVGTYQIACGIPQLTNYVVLLNSGVYTIEKAYVTPVLNALTSTYNGKVQTFTNTTFPYELTYTYRRNGIEVDSVINAGNYIVQGYFAGNNNYYPARSNAVSFIIKKLPVCFNLAENSFIYDGEVKTPQYSFDSSIGLSTNAITIEFENGIVPVEIGKYNYSIIINDDNFECNTKGVLTIAKPFSVSNDLAIIECDDAVYDVNINNLKLVNRSFSGKFDGQTVLQACAFEGAEKVSSGHIFTVRLRARTDSSSVYVYKIDKDNNVSEVVVSVQDGYYVFKVDSLDCQYVITKDIEPMSLITIAVIIVVSIVVIVAIIVALKIRKRHKKKKLALKMANGGTMVVNEEVANLDDENNNLNNSKSKKIKKARMDDIVSSAINNGTINTQVKSITDINNNTDNSNLEENSNKNA